MNKKILLAVLVVIAIGAGTYSFRLNRTFNEAQAHFQQGDALLLNGGSGAALPEFEKTIELYPEHLGAWVGLIECHIEMKKLDLALSSCDKALGYFPKAAQIYKSKAAIYRSQSDAAKEIAALEMALQLEPGDPLTGKLLERARKPAPRKTP